MNAFSNDYLSKEAPDEEKAWKKNLFSRLKKLLILVPYFSLAAGLWSAFIIKRSVTVAMVTVFIALISWGLVMVLALYYARADTQTQESSAFKAAEFIVIWLLQNGMQQSLFFVFPLYFLSATLRFSHVLFLFLMIGVAIVLLWDPLYEKVMERFWTRLSLQIYVTFISLNAILPMLGIANTWALILAGFGSALGLPFFLLTFSSASEQSVRKKQMTLSSVALFVFIPLLLYFGIASWIPPAPLHIVAGGMGTQYENHTLLDPQTELTEIPNALICSSNISSPHGLKDALYHVWSLNGYQTDRILLRISGGRKQGFRTYSKKNRHIKTGKYRCQIETESGQILKSYEILIKNHNEI